MSIKEFVKGIKEKKFTATEACSFFVKRCKSDKKNAVCEIFSSWKNLAASVDTKIEKGEPIGILAGVPILIKDNILYEGHISSQGSKMFENFIAPYSSTVVKKLIAADAVIIGRVNMDEMAMGGSGRSCAFGLVKNAHSDEHTSGGSSSGSGVAVATNLCMAALGTDTGGSVRAPAALNGVVGIKPTFGNVSRYGVSAYTGDLDVVGVIAKNVADAKVVLDIIKGQDELDYTTIHEQTGTMSVIQPVKTLKNVRIGRVIEVMQAAKSSPYAHVYSEVFKKLEALGTEIVDISLPGLKQIISAYYALVTTQACSNFARYSGMRYTNSVDAENISELCTGARSAHFGKEVKFRVMLGSLLLSRGHDYSGLYYKAKILKEKITKDFDRVLNEIDCTIMPVTYGCAPKISDMTQNKSAEYLNDLFTVPINIAKLPAIALPCYKTDEGLPIGIQVVGKRFTDEKMLEIAKLIESEVAYGKI